MGITWRSFPLMFDAVKFGADVRALRRSADISQTELGTMMSFSSGWVSSVERGAADTCKLGDLVALANVLDMDLSKYIVVASS